MCILLFDAEAAYCPFTEIATAVTGPTASGSENTDSFDQVLREMVTNSVNFITIFLKRVARRRTMSTRGDKEVVSRGVPNR